MTLADKRMVVELLLCTGQNPYACFGTTVEIGMLLDVTAHVDIEGNRQWRECRRAIIAAGRSPAAHGSISIEAAYRLIKSSPTLRREWFGAR
jgi:hypothetical protein